MTDFISKNKRLIILTTACLLLVILIWSVFSYMKSLQTLTINIPANSSLAMYKGHKDEHGNSAEKNPSYNFKNSGSYKVKKGIYVYEAVSEDNRYKPIESNLAIDNKKENITINFVMEEAVLSAILPSEANSIADAFYKKYNYVDKNKYTIKYGKLYIDGSWFGGKIVNLQDPSDDKLQFVMHKENGLWVVVAEPIITISQDMNPQVPVSLLEDLNIIVRDNNM